MVLGLADRILAEMEDRGGQNRRGMPIADALKPGPNVIAFAPRYQPISPWRASVGSTRTFKNRTYLSVDATYSLNLDMPSAFDRSRIVVSLLAAGSGEPDVLELTIDQPQTFASAIAQLDRALSFFRPRVAGCIYIFVALIWLIPDPRIEKEL